MWGMSKPIVKIEPSDSSSPNDSNTAMSTEYSMATDSISSSLTSQSDLQDEFASDFAQSNELPDEDIFQVLNCMNVDQLEASGSADVSQTLTGEYPEQDQELSGVRVIQHLNYMVQNKISQKLESFQGDVNNILDGHKNHVEQLIQFYQNTNNQEFEIDEGYDNENIEGTPTVKSNFPNDEYKKSSSLETEAELLKTQFLVQLLTKASFISRTLRKQEYQTS